MTSGVVILDLLYYICIVVTHQDLWFAVNFQKKFLYVIHRLLWFRCGKTAQMMYMRSRHHDNSLNGRGLSNPFSSSTFTQPIPLEVEVPLKS